MELRLGANWVDIHFLFWPSGFQECVQDQSFAFWCCLKCASEEQNKNKCTFQAHCLLGAIIRQRQFNCELLCDNSNQFLAKKADITKEKSRKKTKPNQNKNKWQTPKKKFTLSLREPVCRRCNLWSILQLSEGFFVSNCIFCGCSTVSISVTQSEPSDPVYKKNKKLHWIVASERQHQEISHLANKNFRKCNWYKNGTLWSRHEFYRKSGEQSPEEYST